MTNNRTERLILTPMAETALHALTHGDLRWTPDGWVSSCGVVGIWNSHTIKWLAGRGYCAIRRSRAMIASEGRKALDRLTGWAA
jgi:hypothetical protein